MSGDRRPHLVERAVERMAELGLGGVTVDTAPAPAPGAASPRPAAADPPGPTRASASPGPAAAAAEAPIVSLSTLEAAGMVVGSARRSRVAEEWNVTAGQLMRTLRVVRRNTAGAATSNLMLVTSCKPNEGKSFSSINLAASVSLGRMSDVLLLDLDSKPGALTALLGVADRPGLFDLVADPELRPEALIVTTAIPGFAFLPIGRAASGGPGSAERSVTRPVVAAVEALARRFSDRLVILDSPPCLATSDASTLAGAVGQIAMIIEAERTQHNNVEAALELLRPCPNITLVLNKVRQTTTHAFGDYDYYDG
jgi:receptor protein-tyrosine kinase